MTYRELALGMREMSQAEVLEGIRNLEGEVFISVEMAGKACGLGGNTIRLQAREDKKTGKDVLGFRTIVASHRVIVNRKSFFRVHRRNDFKLRREPQWY